MTNKIPPAAFSYYVALGPERSYQKVAEKFGVDKRTVTRHAAKDQWAERLEEAERIAQAESEEQAVDILREMNERHLRIAKALQGKALEALRALPIGKAADVIRALELDPRYVDVIVRRWEQATGRKAVLDGDGQTFEQVAEERNS